MRAFALCWLAHDFCTVGESRSEVEIYWSEWRETFEVPKGYVGLLLSECPEIPNLPELMEDDDRLDGSEFTPHEKITISSFLDWNESYELRGFCDGFLAALVAYYLRDDIVSALLRGFAGTTDLFASMQVTDEDRCHFEEQMGDEIETEIWMIERSLNDEQDVEAKERLQDELIQLENQLNSSSLNKEAYKRAKEHAINGPFYFGDEEYIAKMDRFQWIRDKCPVIVAGIPSARFDH